jgi:hypothetical protein
MWDRIFPQAADFVLVGLGENFSRAVGNIVLSAGGAVLSALQPVPYRQEAVTPYSSK